MSLKIFLFRAHSFRTLLLITCATMLLSCKTPAVQSSVSKQNIPVTAGEITPDSSIIRLYAPYKLALEKDLNRVISFSETEMIKERPESKLTNFMADLLMKKARDISNDMNLDIQPDISYFNYGGIRSSIPKGEITVSRAYELMPFENLLVFVQLDGAKVKQFLDALAAGGGDSVSGVRFKISEGKANNIEVGGKAFDTSKTYWIATNSYVADGGDGLSMFQENRQKIGTDVLIRDLIVDYFSELQKQGIPINASLDGRISYE